MTAARDQSAQPQGQEDQRGRRAQAHRHRYFNATSKGIADGAKELGNVSAKTDGPTKANIDEQITFIDNYITQGVDGILFAANDRSPSRRC